MGAIDPERSIDPDVLLAAVIEAVAENLPVDDADVIELPSSAEGDECDGSLTDRLGRAGY